MGTRRQLRPGRLGILYVAGQQHQTRRTLAITPRGCWIRRARIALVLVTVVVLGMAVGVLVSLQRQLIYFPDSRPVPPAAEAIPGARDVTLHTADGLELGAWFLPARAEANEDAHLAGLVAPGNGGNRSDRASLGIELSRRGLAVLLMDYRGYGGNPGKPSEDGLANDADAAVQALEQLGYPPRRTIYYGESLGGGVVAALSARQEPAGIVLRSPFTDLADVGAHHYPWLPVRLVLQDRFPVTAYLRNSDVPVTVIYGDRDTVVPTRQSAQVADEARSLAERVVIPGADHNDAVMAGRPVAAAVERLARAVGDGRSDG